MIISLKFTNETEKENHLETAKKETKNGAIKIVEYAGSNKGYISYNKH